MPRAVNELLDELRERCESGGRSEAALSRAGDLAARLPFVHRTGRAGRHWQSIFENARLEAATPGTRWEQEALGIESATYFFWGYGAYPYGTVALLLERLPSDSRCTATPFDTGGCEAGHLRRADCELSEDERRSVLDRFMLVDGGRVSEYGAAYIADIFDDPIDYVRRPQYSQPDRPPVHGLTSVSHDRRAWTIEAQVHGDVAVPPERVIRVVLRSREQYRDLPARYRRLAVVSAQAHDFGQGIADAVLAYAGVQA
jgi:hypothetical protein